MRLKSVSELKFKYRAEFAGQYKEKGFFTKSMIFRETSARSMKAYTYGNTIQ